jgi:hypothetical protein
VLADLLDVVQVLPRDVGQRNVQDVEVLLADQVQQQVQRAFEGFKKDLQRIGRDVQILRQLEQRFAVQTGRTPLALTLRSMPPTLGLSALPAPTPPLPPPDNGGWTENLEHETHSMR